MLTGSLLRLPAIKVMNMEQSRCNADAKHIRHFLDICDGNWHSCIYVFIYIFKKGILRFQWWFIFWISFAVSILTIICSILLLGLYGYAFYKGVIKKGKNH